ncbi:MAG: transglycosylase SLT domain-containing protein [Pseudomonadota bacterium]
MTETAAETITLSNGQVIVVNLADPVEAAPAARNPDLNNTSSNDLVARLRSSFSLNTDLNEERLQRQKQLLTGKQAYIDRVLNRAQRNLYLSVSEAERRQLPTELALLPIIESAYDPMALSRSQAAGLWQFIPDTGRLYGLEQSWYYDARRDPLASTQAAYDYLSKLNGMFNSWELALAAYNAGPGTVSRAIKRNKALGLGTDYWSLKLPAETMAYVPRFLAVAALFKSPESFNVRLASIPNRPHYRTVNTPGPMTLNEVADLTGLSPQLIRDLNPALRRDSNAPHGPYQWHLPANLDVALENQLMQSAGTGRVVIAKASDARVTDNFIATTYKPGNDVVNATPSTFSTEATRYLVQAGDTWSSIARQFGLSTSAVLTANFSQNTDTLSIGRELSLPTARRINVASTELISVSEAVSDARIELRRRVVQGDTMVSLSRQYQVTLAELRAWNGSIQSLQIGQELILRVLPSALNSKAL